MLKGIAASAGVSVAKVYKLETPKVVIEKKAGVAEEEVKKFEDALEKTKKDKEYILKEAEMIVNEYMSKIENKDKKEIFNKEAKIKYKKLRKYAIVTTVICAIQTILLIVL